MTQDRRNQLVIAVPLWILAVIALLFLLQAMRVLLVPIALAGLASAVLYPLVARLERLGVSPVLGAALVADSAGAAADAADHRQRHAHSPG